VGSHTRSGRGGEEKISQSLPGIEPQLPRCSLVQLLYLLQYRRKRMKRSKKNEGWEEGKRNGQFLPSR
jgi:hypothetical protein